jgi:predicted RNase H-like nuclease (RuvC/YqgF family)
VNVFVLIILVFFVVVPIGQAIAKSIETKATREQLPKEPEQAGRLEELERQMMYLVEQVEGIQEHQDFLTRLLENRPTSIPPAHSEEEIT